MKDLGIDLQAYLVQEMRANPATKNFQDVTLVLSKSLQYGHKAGTASCTLDGEIDARGQTILASAEHKKTSAGADIDGAIREACRKAVDEMVSDILARR